LTKTRVYCIIIATTFEVPGKNFGLEHPDEARWILEHELIPADELNQKHRETTKFFVARRPDLFVRANFGHPADDTRQAIRAAEDLLAQSPISVLPAWVVEHYGDAYVITNRVTGAPLDSLLSQQTTDELSRQVDTMYARLIESTVHAIRQRAHVPRDICGPNQYMLGSIEGNPDQKIWLVDLPIYSRPLVDREDIADALFESVSGIIDAETASGEPMPTARQAAKEVLLDLGVQEGTQAEVIANAARYALVHGEVVFDDEDMEELPTTYLD
jgi:hypothetical protein